VLSFARHAAVDALTVYGVLWAVLTVMISTWALLTARRVRRRRAAWVAAEVDALLREAARAAVNHPDSRPALRPGRVAGPFARRVRAE